MLKSKITIAVALLFSVNSALAINSDEPDALKELYLTESPAPVPNANARLNNSASDNTPKNEVLSLFENQAIEEQTNPRTQEQQAAPQDLNNPLAQVEGLSTLPVTAPNSDAVSIAQEQGNLDITLNQSADNQYSNLPALGGIDDNNHFVSDLSIAQLGAKKGIMLGAGLCESGIDFTLPVDKVITAAHLGLNLQISEDLAKRADHLEILLNGQPVGTLPLSDYSGPVHFELEMPYEFFSSVNTLSFNIDDQELSCMVDYTPRYRVTILPDSSFALEGHQLDVDSDLSLFPLPFLDPYDVTKSTINVIFGENPENDVLSAAAILASWFGIKADYRGTEFIVNYEKMPVNHAVIFGRPGQNVAGVNLPLRPGITVVDNPLNETYKLILIAGKEISDFRNAIGLLTSQTLKANTLAINASLYPIAPRKPYDADKWIPTDRKVYLNELLKDNQSLISTGIYHSPISLSFRAAPDLYQLYGQPVDLYLKYNFPLEKSIEERSSWLNVTLSGNYLDNLPVNKIGLLENLWKLFGGDGRLEERNIPIQPYMIYGDNSLDLYFDIKMKSNAACSLLHDNNLKSVISDQSYIDLSNTDHYARLPNLSFFVGASFPFTRLADYGETVIILPKTPSSSEVKVMLDFAARAGNATGVAINFNQVYQGIDTIVANTALVTNKDLFIVATTENKDFLEHFIKNSAFKYNGSDLNVKDLSPFSNEGSMLDSVQRLLVGDFRPENLDANRYLSSKQYWRGFLSFISPYDYTRIAVVATATNDSQISLLSDDLDNENINRDIRGDISLISGKDEIRSFHVGDTIYTGNVTFMFHLLHFAGTHEIWLAVFAFILLFILGATLSNTLKARARKRLGE